MTCARGKKSKQTSIHLMKRWSSKGFQRTWKTSKKKWLSFLINKWNVPQKLKLGSSQPCRFSAMSGASSLAKRGRTITDLCEKHEVTLDFNSSDVKVIIKRLPENVQNFEKDLIPKLKTQECFKSPRGWTESTLELPRKERDYFIGRKGRRITHLCESPSRHQIIWRRRDRARASKEQRKKIKKKRLRFLST